MAPRGRGRCLFVRLYKTIAAKQGDAVTPIGKFVGGFFRVVDCFRVAFRINNAISNPRAELIHNTIFADVRDINRNGGDRIKKCCHNKSGYPEPAGAVGNTIVSNAKVAINF